MNTKLVEFGHGQLLVSHIIYLARISGGVNTRQRGQATVVCAL